MKKTLLILGLILAVKFVYCQEDSLKGIGTKNSIYLELGGNAFIYSINYDRVILSLKSNISLIVRGGLAYWPRNFIFPEPTEPGVLIPFEIDMLFGRNGKFFELGVGINIVKSFENRSLSENWGLGGTARIGYRYISEKGSLYRIAFVPLFSGKDGNYPWLGISIGQSF